MDYKKFYNRVKKTYPIVIQILDSDPYLKDIEKLPVILERFTEITGYTKDDVLTNKNDSKILFIAVVVKLGDPLFFLFNEKVMHRSILHLSRILRCNKYQISYIIKKCKNFYDIYPQFRSDVDKLYEEIKTNDRGRRNIF